MNSPLNISLRTILLVTNTLLNSAERNLLRSITCRISVVNILGFHSLICTEFCRVSWLEQSLCIHGSVIYCLLLLNCNYFMQALPPPHPWIPAPLLNGIPCKNKAFVHVIQGRGVLPGNLGEGVRPASRKPYPISDHGQTREDASLGPKK